MSNDCKARFEKNKEGINVSLFLPHSYIEENTDEDDSADVLFFIVKAVQRGAVQAINHYIDGQVKEDADNELKKMLFKKAARAMGDVVDNELMRNLAGLENDEEMQEKISKVKKNLPDELKPLFDKLEKMVKDMK